MNNNRQLPSLPVAIRKLPNIEKTTSKKPYFDIDDTENEELIQENRFIRPGELYYYQTSSSSSTTSESSSSEQSDIENNEEQYVGDNQDDADEDDGDDEVMEDDVPDEQLVL